MQQEIMILHIRGLMGTQEKFLNILYVNNSSVKLLLNKKRIMMKESLKCVLTKLFYFKDKEIISIRLCGDGVGQREGGNDLSERKKNDFVSSYLIVLPTKNSRVSQETLEGKELVLIFCSQLRYLFLKVQQKDHC